MLTRLGISDFAIISHLEIDLYPGLNILSGETGAGKSIIINAVNLLLGARATTDLIREGAKEARVEGLFQVPHISDFSQVLKGMDIPFEGELLIKRIITRAGKNRVTINGSMATVGMLASIGPQLLSISGQHANQALLKPDTHLFLLDEFGGLARERESLGQEVRQFRALNGEISRLKEEITRAQEKQDLARLQADEIDRAGIRAGEDEELDREKRRLKFAEELFRVAHSAYAVLYDEEDAVLPRISRCLKDLEKASRLDASLERAIGALKGAIAEVEEASYTLREYLEHMEQDPKALERIEDRIFLLNQLKRKYGPTLEDVLAYRESISESVDEVDKKKALLTGNQEAMAQIKERMISKAKALSRERMQVAKNLEGAVEKELEQLQMKGTVFKVSFEGPSDNEISNPDSLAFLIGEEGFDRVEFMISPNVGEPLRPLARIASGGELSRIVLALKSILARKASVETIIFDEVDSGISGATAEVVGEKLLELSRRHQIICITHLPQIASKGEAHFLVKKQVKNGRTITTIAALDKKERIMEIARLLGGKKITEKAISRAEEMLS